MQIHRIAKLGEDFYSLGLEAVPVFLLDGPAPALFDAGFATLASVYEDDARRVLGSRRPNYLFLTHAHWDHIGGAGHFKEQWPDMKILGPSRIREILSREGAVRSIEELSHEGAHDLRYWGASPMNETPFKSFDLDVVIGPDEGVELSGDLHVKAIHTPGHTWEHMSYWVPERRILVASEAVGCEHGGRMISEFMVDYDAYRESLKSLIRLGPEILCTAHGPVPRGSEAGAYLRRSLEAAEEYVRTVEDLLRELGGDLEETVMRIKALQWEDLPYPKQPEPAYLWNTRVRVRHILERMEKRKSTGKSDTR